MKLFTTLLLAICFSATSFAQLTQETYFHDGMLRDYLLYRPAGLPPGAPLVLVLHGYTGSASGSLSTYGMNAVADANGFAVCYPQGTADASGTNFWNVDFPGEQVDDVGFLTNLAIDLGTTYDLDAGCTYVCGMSNGGMMSYYLGCERPDVFSSFASVTGTITSNFLQSCLPNITVPFMQIHGTADIVVPYNGGSSAAATFGEFLPVEFIMRKWAQANSCQTFNTFNVPNGPAIDFSTVQVGHLTNCDSGLKARFYKVQGGGHTWPGSPPIPFFDFLQPTNQDINASQEIWNFFSSVCSPSGFGLAANDDAQPEFSLYPNPSQGEINIHLTGMQTAQVRIFSIEGRLVESLQLREGQNRLSLAHLNGGIYLALVDGLVAQKFILE